MSAPHSYGSLPGSPTPRPEHHVGAGYFPTDDRAAASFGNASSGGVDIPSSPHSIRERRSSFSDRFLTMGGVNSLENFARSWTRAAAFPELTPSRQSFVSTDGFPDVDYASEEPCLERTTSYGSVGTMPPVALVPNERIGDSMSSNAVHAAKLFLSDQKAADTERDPLLVKTVAKEDGVLEHVLVGQSTLPQTVFNSINVLVGIGLLSLPLGVRYSGWLLGMLILVLSVLVTRYTAKLLAKCLDKSPNKTLVTYSDIAYIAFGHRFRIFVAALFSLELVVACVALVVLFADSLAHLVPALSALQWKIVAGVVLTPLFFLPLRVLSFSSVIGILSTISVVIIVFVDGLIKPTAPGSLRMPMHTPFLPTNWATVPISLGLILAAFGGHSVFPNIYKDMRHPAKYARAIDYTYGFTMLLDAGMAVIGLLMFGEAVRDEVTSSVLALPDAYPESLSIALVCFIAIIPLTKTPLNARPIVSTLEILFGLDKRALGAAEAAVGVEPLYRGVARAAVKIAVVASIVGIAIVCPGFDSIMSFMGSALCLTICVVLPLCFYLKIYGDEVSRAERWADIVLIVLGSIMSVIGTVWAFLPREQLLGA